MNQAMLLNISEDVMLSQKVKYPLRDAPLLRLGRNPENDLVMDGLGIQHEHISIKREDGKLFLVDCDSKAKDYTLLNGFKVKDTAELAHNDRLVLGTNTYLIYKAAGEQLDVRFDWEYLQQEIIENMQAVKSMEMEAEIKKYKARASLERAKVQDELSDLRAEYEEKLKLLEEQVHQKAEQEEIEQEAEEIKHEIAFMMEEEEQKQEEEKALPLMKRAMEVKLARYYKQVQEMNLIAKTFGKDVSLSSKVAYELSEDTNDSPAECHFRIEVVNRDHGYVYRWDLPKFDHRYLLVQQLMHSFMQNNMIPSLSPAEDPFWDPPEPELIGQTYIQLLNIPYIIENPCILEVIAENKQGGQLIVNTVPTDQAGLINLAEVYDQQDQLIEEPEEMLGKSLYFNVEIEQLTFEKAYSVSDIYVQYSFMDNNNFQVTFKSPP